VPSLQNKVALVTGASSGIGKAAVKQLLQEGCVVYAAARRLERMADLESAGAKLLSMDMTSEESLQEGVKTLLKEQERIDILVNNAGYGSYGALEDVPMEEARRQFEVNIFGLARLTQLVLPSMRKHQFGKIINISSMGGKVYTPFGGWYHATKHALEGLTDCLRVETKEFGIHPVVIQPGGIATDWGLIAAENLKKNSAKGPYKERAQKAAEGMARMYGSGKLTSPEVIAKLIVKAAKKKRPRTRYIAGMGARPALFIRKVFGDRVFDWIIGLAF